MLPSTGSTVLVGTVSVMGVLFQWIGESLPFVVPEDDLVVSDLFNIIRIDRPPFLLRRERRSQIGEPHIPSCGHAELE